MTLIERAKNILLTPKTEWLRINSEQATPQQILTGYVLPLAILSAAGAFLRFLSPTFFSFNFIIWQAVSGLLGIIIGFYISTYVIDALAPSFSSQKDLGKSAQLVAYSNTPVWLAGILSFLPFIGFLIIIAGWVYSIYLFYTGLGVMKQTPEDKKVVYMIVAFLVMIVISAIVSAVLMGLFSSIFGFGVYGRGAFGLTIFL